MDIVARFVGAYFRFFEKLLGETLGDIVGAIVLLQAGIIGFSLAASVAMFIIGSLGQSGTHFFVHP